MSQIEFDYSPYSRKWIYRLALYRLQPGVLNFCESEKDNTEKFLAEQGKQFDNGTLSCLFKVIFQEPICKILC